MIGRGRRAFVFMKGIALYPSSPGFFGVLGGVSTPFTPGCGAPAFVDAAQPIVGVCFVLPPTYAHTHI